MHIHVHIHTHIKHEYTQKQSHIYTSLSTYAHICIDTHAFTHVHMHAYADVFRDTRDETPHARQALNHRATFKVPIAHIFVGK